MPSPLDKVILLVALLSLLPTRAWPQEELIPPPSPEELTAEEKRLLKPSQLLPPSTSLSDLYSIFRQGREELGRSEEAAGAWIKRVLTAKYDMGVVGTSDGAAVLTHLAFQAHQAGKDGKARMLYTTAKELGPLNAGPPRALAWLDLADHPLAAGPAIGTYIQSLKILLAHPAERLRLLANHGLALTLALASALLLALGLLAATRLYLLVHDLGHLLPKGVTSPQIGAFLALTLTTLLLLGSGPLPVLLLLVILLWLYLSRAERALLALLVILVGALPLGLHWWCKAARFPLSQEHVAYLLQADLPLQPRLQALDKALADDPDDFLLLFVRALTLKRSGSLDLARLTLEKAARQEPSNPLVANNLGNVLFAQGYLAEALAQYKVALEAAPDLAEGHYNMSRLLIQMGRMDEGMKHLTRAEAVGADLVERQRQWESSSTNRYLVDTILPTEAFLSHYFPREDAAGPMADHIWAMLSPWASRGLTPYGAGLVLALLMILSALRSRLAVAMRCAKCGRPVCRRCNPEIAGSNHCGQCYHVFVKGTGIAPRARTLKEIQVRRYQARRKLVRRIMAFGITGSVHLTSSRAIRGFILAFVTFLFLAHLLLGQGPFLSLHLSRPTGLLQALLLGLAALALHALSVMKGLRLANKE